MYPRSYRESLVRPGFKFKLSDPRDYIKPVLISRGVMGKVLMPHLEATLYDIL